ncbi:MAG: ParB/RepB/Spo0J family partition protein [Christensenellaceae bacterium]|jgi:ParB family chromosome partitioning protein
MAKPKQRGLGKGLGALMVELPGGSAQNENSVTEVDIYLVDNDQSQPRKNFDKEKLDELAQSIKVHGIMQPVIVCQKEGRYTIVAGERRFRAAKIAGLTKIPVIVKEFTDRQILELSLIENIQREDLNPMEQADALNRLVTEYSLKQEEVAERVGKSRSAIANLMRLLSLPEKVKKMVMDGTLSAGHARCLLPLQDEKRILDTANLIVSREYSVRQAEKLVQELQSSPAKKAKQKKKQALEILQAEEEISKALSTKVRINGNLEKGKITIDYYTKEQLEQLYGYLKNAE